MPYLNPKFRNELNFYGDFTSFRNYMKDVYTDQDWAGAVNYANYMILKDRMKRTDKAHKKWSKYWRFAMWVGTMVCCILEVYRRIIGPYEDEVIKENGDV